MHGLVHTVHALSYGQSDSTQTCAEQLRYFPYLIFLKDKLTIIFFF